MSVHRLKMAMPKPNKDKEVALLRSIVRKTNRYFDSKVADLTDDERAALERALNEATE